MSLPFIKMHGTGNDFVILDARTVPLPTSLDFQRLADRRFGVGCDQIIILRPSRTADVFMDIRNSDGSPSGACGNATRCVVKLLGSSIRIETAAGLLEGHLEADGTITVDLGPVRLDWREIPLAKALDTNALTFDELPLGCAINVGNPHCVFFVPNVEAIDLATIGRRLEHHPLFPERCNIEFAEALGDNRFRVRVWERGSGVTLACGTGAVAVGVAAFRRKLAGRHTTIIMDGGTLYIEYLPDGHGLLRGEAVRVFEGVWEGS
ncbi:MAG: diaminopimelate epimerase [Holosporales bacterium]|jgi:diaminopimelate epimerase